MKRGVTVPQVLAQFQQKSWQKTWLHESRRAREIAAIYMLFSVIATTCQFANPEAGGGLSHARYHEGVGAIHLQIQPERSPSLNAQAATASLSSLDASARVTEGMDEGRYINIDFTPADAVALWREIRDRLSAEPELARATIVACEGKQGWDDYLLLHHYDQTLVLDEMPTLVAKK